MSIVDIVNQICCPTKPVTTEAECLSYLMEVKVLAMNPAAFPLQSFVKQQKPPLSVSQFDPLQQIFYAFFGELRQKPTIEDYRILKVTLQDLRVNVRADPSQSLVQALRQQNPNMLLVQKLLFQLTGSADLSETNVGRAAELVGAVKKRAKAESEDFVDMLITKKQAFESDQRQFAQICQVVFGELNERQAGNPEETADYFIGQVVAFEEAYSIKFSSALAKVFDGKVPAYAEPLAPDFLLTHEINTFATLIKKVFGVETKRPLQFIQYLKSLRSDLQTRLKCKDVCLAGCIVRVLNEATMAEAQKMHQLLTGNAENFNGLEDFVKTASNAIQKCSKSCELRFGELCEFAVFDYIQANPDLQKQLVVSKFDLEREKRHREEEAKHIAKDPKHKSEELILRKKLQIQVPYYTQIFVSKQQNQSINEQLLGHFQILHYSDIEEQKTANDNNQPLFVLDAVIKRLSAILEGLGFTQRGLIARLTAYEKQLSQRVVGWFIASNKLTASSLKKEFKVFNNLFLAVGCFPFRWIFENYARSKQMKFGFDYVHGHPRSELTELISEQLGAAMNVNILDIYRFIIQPLQAECGKQPLLEFMGSVYKKTTIAFMQDLSLKLTGEKVEFQHQSQFGDFLTKNEAKFKKEYANIFEIFGYSELMLAPMNFVIVEELIPMFQKVPKLFGFDVRKKEHACMFVFNLPSIFIKMRQDLICCAKGPDTMLDTLDTMMKIIGSDKIMTMQEEDPHVRFTYMIAGKEADAMLQGKHDKFFYLQQSFEHFKVGTKSAAITPVFEKIDPKNYTQWQEFLVEYNGMLQSGKFGFGGEKIWKQFEERLYAYYIVCKKCYGDDIKNFQMLHAVLTKDGSAQLDQAVAASQVKDDASSSDTPVDPTKIAEEPEPAKVVAEPKKEEIVVVTEVPADFDPFAQPTVQQEKAQEAPASATLSAPADFDPFVK